MALTGAPRRPAPGGCVLALRALGLGDVLTAVAALRGARRAWPDRRLVLVAPRALGELLVDHRVVDACAPSPAFVPTRDGPPRAGPGLLDAIRRATGGAGDVVALNLHGRGPASHRLLAALAPSALVAYPAPAAGHGAGPAWRADEHEVDRWCRLVSWAGGPCGPEDLRLAAPRHRRGIVVHPGAADAARRWPVERWAVVARAMTGLGEPVVVTGGAAEAALAHRLCRLVPGARDLSGASSLRVLDALVAEARLVLCADTGVGHLATAHGTPSVLLFGPAPPGRWGPRIDPERHRVLWAGPLGPGGQGVLDPALARIGPGTVIAAAHEVLDRTRTAAQRT